MLFKKMIRNAGTHWKKENQLDERGTNHFFEAKRLKEGGYITNTNARERGGEESSTTKRRGIYIKPNESGMVKKNTWQKGDDSGTKGGTVS